MITRQIMLLGLFASIKMILRYFLTSCGAWKRYLGLYSNNIMKHTNDYKKDRKHSSSSMVSYYDTRDAAAMCANCFETFSNGRVQNVYETGCYVLGE